MAALCDFEISHILLDQLRPVYKSDVFLRPDLPCDDICIANKTYREANIRGFPHKCSGTDEFEYFPASLFQVLYQDVLTEYEYHRDINTLGIHWIANGG